MDWSRAKNLLIALLLCVNTFLIVTYVMRENETRNDELTLRSDVAGILAAQGISVEDELIPLDSVQISAAVLPDIESRSALAEKVFGEVSESVGAGSTTYLGEDGNIMFSKESFSLVYESGNGVENETMALELAESVAKKLSVSAERKLFTCRDIDGGYVIEVPQVFSGITVFDGAIEFRISDSGSVIAHGKFVGCSGFESADGKGRRTSSLMLDFADAIREEGHDEVTVEAIELGYSSKYRSDGAISLNPMVRITADCGTYGVDVSNGAVSRL